MNTFKGKWQTALLNLSKWQEEEHLESLVIALRQGRVTDQFVIKSCDGFRWVDNFQILSALRKK